MYPFSELCTSTSTEGVWAGTRVKHPAVWFNSSHHPGSWPGSAVDSTDWVRGW